eukprot:gene9457-11203_t
MSARIVVFDLETTGLNVKTNEIISVSMRVLDTDDRFDEFVRPRKLPIPHAVSVLTGISSRYLTTKDRWETVGSKLCDWLERDVIKGTVGPFTITFVGHNVRRILNHTLLTKTDSLQKCSYNIAEFHYSQIANVNHVFALTKSSILPNFFQHKESERVKEICKIRHHTCVLCGNTYCDFFAHSC